MASKATKKPGFYGSPQAFSSASDDWQTPRTFVELLKAEFTFGLDVCVSRRNRVTARYFGLDHSDPARRDGLAAQAKWTSTPKGTAVFMNPPYGTAIGLWMAKACDAATAGTTVVCLVPARTDTRWWHEYVMEPGHEVRLVRGRLKFGHGTAPAPFPSALVVMRNQPNPVVASMHRSLSEVRGLRLAA